MTKIIVIALILFSNLGLSQDQTAQPKEVDPSKISLKGLDKNVRISFEKTKDLILESRKSNDEKTEADATQQWCLMLHNYDFLEEAKSCYFIVGLKNKEDAKWPYLYAKAAQQKGEVENAVMGLTETLRRNSMYLPAHYHLIELQHEAGNLKSAFELLGQIPTDLKLLAPILNLSGDLFFDTENYHVAIGYYQEVLNRNSEAGALNYKIAQAYLALNEAELAEQFIQKSNSIGVKVVDPYYQDVLNQTVGEVPYLIQAKRALQFNQFETAIENYKKALEFNPKSETGLINLAVAHYKNQQIELAKTNFRKALEINPNQETALFNLASVAKSEGRFLESMDLFERFVTIKPNDLEAMEMLLELYEQQGQYQKIIHLLQSKNLLDSPKYLFLISRSQINLEQYDGAINSLEKIIETSPNDIPSLLSLAKIYSQVPELKMRDGKKSLQYAQKAFELHKNIKTYWQMIHALDESKKCKQLKPVVSEFAALANANESAVYSELAKQRPQRLHCKFDG